LLAGTGVIAAVFIGAGVVFLASLPHFGFDFGADPKRHEGQLCLPALCR